MTLRKNNQIKTPQLKNRGALLNIISKGNNES